MERQQRTNLHKDHSTSDCFVGVSWKELRSPHSMHCWKVDPFSVCVNSRSRQAISDPVVLDECLWQTSSQGEPGVMRRERMGVI